MSNNKIVHQVTKEYMKKNKKRTIITLFGIVFMVMLMTCVFVGKDTAIHYLEELASLEKGNWHISVYDITDEEHAQIRNMKDVEQIGVSANFEYTLFPQSKNQERPYLYIKSYSKDAFELHNITVVEGRLPEKENEIILNVEAVTDGADIKIGDKIEAEFFERYICKDEEEEYSTLFSGGFSLDPGQCLKAPAGFPYWGENEDFYEKMEFTGENATYEVVGFMEKPFFEKSEAAGYTAICYNNGTQIVGDKKNVTIRFDLERNGDYDTNLERIIGTDCEMEYNEMLLTFTANAKDSTINGIVNFMSVFFVVLIIAASVVLIYNVFNMSFEERTRYLGMLSSVGATGKQKRSSVYYEAFSLLCIGLPVGFVTGLLVVKFGMMALKPHLDTLLGMYSATSLERVSLEISSIGVAITVILSIVTVWVSAFLPARKIGKIGPIECIRGNVTKRTRKYSNNKFGIEVFGAEGLLAMNSVSREKKKTRGLIGAVTMFMIVLIVTSFSSKALTTIVNYAMSNDGTINVKLESDFMATVYMNSKEEVDYEELKERVQRDESVESCVEYYDGMFLGGGDMHILSEEYLNAYTRIMEAYGIPEKEQNEYIKNFYTPVNFIGLDDTTLAKIIEVTGTDKNIMSDKNVKPVIIVQNGELSTENMRFEESDDVDFKFYEIENMSEIKVGETFDVSVMNGATENYENVPVTVAGYATNDQLKEYFSFHSEMLWVITDLETVQQLVDMEQTGEEEGLHSYSKDLFIKFRDKSSQLYRELNAMHFETVNSDEWEGLIVISSTFYDGKTIAGAINAVIEIMLICFVILTSVICMLNLYNSTKGRITGRRKELGILRSMGMTEKQMRKMLLLEAVSVLTKSVIIAILVTIPVIFTVENVLVNLFGTVSFGSPIGAYLLAVVSATVAVMFITIITHSREKSENILEDIRRESI